MELQAIQNLEKSILCAVMHNTTLLKELCVNLRKDDFLFLGHTAIFQMFQMFLEHEIQNFSDKTIAKPFVNRGIDEYIILDILSSTPSTNFIHDIKKVQELSNERNNHINTCAVKMDHEKVYFMVETTEAFWRVEFIKDIAHQVQSISFGDIPSEIAPTFTATLAQFETLGVQNLVMVQDNNNSSPCFLYTKSKTAT